MATTRFGTCCFENPVERTENQLLGLYLTVKQDFSHSFKNYPVSHEWKKPALLASSARVKL
ncbi:MAG: hypothetical protein ACFFD4_22125 [Candidatus Odinarchaeota archaeon]